MKLVCLFENSLIMFGPYLVFILFQSIGLLTNDYVIVRDINYVMSMGLGIILYGPQLVFQKYKFTKQQLKKGLVFMLIFAVFTTFISFILLKYIKIGQYIHPIFHLDASLFWKIVIIIGFLIFAFMEEFIWRFHCYKVTYGLFDFHDLGYEHDDLILSEYGQIYLSLNYGLFYFLCCIIFINVYKALIIGIIFALVGRTLQYCRKEGIYFCILANFGMKIPLTTLICIRWFDRDNFNNFFN